MPVDIDRIGRITSAAVTGHIDFDDFIGYRVRSGVRIHLVFPTDRCGTLVAFTPSSILWNFDTLDSEPSGDHGGYRRNPLTKRDLTSGRRTEMKCVSGRE